jgi:hypothetical protein
MYDRNGLVRGSVTLVTVLLSSLARLAGWRNGNPADTARSFDLKRIYDRLPGHRTHAERLVHFGLVTHKGGSSYELTADALRYLEYLCDIGYLRKPFRGVYELTAAAVLALEMAVREPVDDMV